MSEHISPIRIFLVEDETLNQDIINAHLEDLGYGLHNKSRSGEEALALIEQQPPDLALLDIDLRRGRGTMDGIELAMALRKKYTFPIIFITAFQDVQTYERTRKVKPDGYLTKPISPAGLLSSIEKALEEASNRLINPQPLPEEDQWELDSEGKSYLLEDDLFIKIQSVYQKVPVSSIQYIQADANYLKIFTEKGKIVVTTNLSNFTRQFEHPTLLRVSRSHIINVNFIESFEDMHTVVVAGQVIPIGKTYRGAVQERFRFIKTTR
ncbi:MAG: response regulator transcription factor [Bacteroidota bacterium]